MVNPQGKLTAVQYEIMEAVWESDDAGATASVIWQRVAAERDVGRTTVLKQIQRLEQRGWLQRGHEGRGVARYTAGLKRDDAAQMLATDFVTDFFGGSLSDLVMSALGSRKVKPEEVKRLRRLLDEQQIQRKKTRKKQ